ncbi:MFS transporter [Corynebacterium bovis]|uniref:MFS family permease n=1 Tax=Corynebacterium bovis DSM 20582 = CIP 54.80 TaxID=927655 RepID=A0A8H9Y8A2_9CORY|nr:MFS transporter [Corynebacterium bovis]MBB3115281.1 MFS family permease [Corynebacterium bovis DSM 20582 = CIP 54.80]RRO79984.1 MFS transporter [Corynebacterium bovis]RRO83641.1 MFS transporter [Corynebacterium bovis]RRO84066.1 MFS transporter [Corynebacterium bovis]RRO89672.1 MFS transporter [Corynebacterium bovis]
MAFRSVLADTTPLRYPRFRRLWTANIITVIGAQLTIIAVPAQIYVITGSSAYVGLAGAFGLVPLIVFGLYGGSLADHMDRRRLLLFTTSGLILTAVAFWAQAAAGVGNVWLILGIFAVQQACFAVNQPARTAVIPRLVGVENIAAATSLTMTVQQAGAIVGPLVGGALIPFVGFAWLYLGDAVALFATLWAVISLPPMRPGEGPDGAGAAGSRREGDDAASPRRAGLRSVLEGARYLVTRPVLLVSFVVDIIAMVFGMPRALIPQMSTVDFGEPAGGGLIYALLFAALPVGAVLGGVFSGRITRMRRQGLGVTVSVVVWGLAIVVMGLAVTAADGVVGVWAAVALVAFAAGGAADMVSAVLRSAMVQETADDELRGRLQGVFIVVVAGGPRLADILHGWGGTTFGAGPTTAAGGVLAIVGTLVAVALAPAFLRHRAPSAGRVASSSPGTPTPGDGDRPAPGDGDDRHPAPSAHPAPSGAADTTTDRTTEQTTEQTTATPTTPTRAGSTGPERKDS